MYLYNSVLDPVNWLSTKPCLQLCNGLISFYIIAAGNSERGVLQKSASVSPGWMIVTTRRMTAFVAVHSFFLRLYIPVHPFSETILSNHLLLSRFICQILEYAASNVYPLVLSLLCYQLVVKEKHFISVGET